MSLARVEDAYQAFTKTTAVYPRKLAVEYVALALADEVGEVVEKLKDHIGQGWPASFPHELQEGVLGECGDVLYYVARMADELDYPLSQVIERKQYVGFASVPGSIVVTVVAAAHITGRVKKRLRDGDTWTDEKFVENEGKILHELSVLVSGIEQITRYFGQNIHEVMHANQAKLEDRAARGVIKGDGDKR